MLKRLPKGYIGVDHQTRGGDILAILDCVHVPEASLGAEMTRKLRQTRADGWYPIADLLDMLEKLDEKLGEYRLKQVGWTIFQRYHAEKARQAFPHAKALLSALDAMYHEANRGTAVGRWRVASFEPGRAELEKTTPHHCAMEQGILEEALRTIGVMAKIHQSECFRKGAPLCRYVIETSVSDARWAG